VLYEFDVAMFERDIPTGALLPGYVHDEGNAMSHNIMLSDPFHPEQMAVSRELSTR
jgi:hypothetical protein